MKSIDDLIIDKIYELVNYALSKVINPDIKIDKITQLDETMVNSLKEQYGIEGIILDVDDTLRKDMKKIPKCNEEWIENIKGKMKVIIVSNGLDRNMEDFFKLKDIEYIGFAHKPLKKNFVKACKKMNLQPDKVLVVGDSLLDDIYGGQRNNMKTLLVKGVDEER